MRRVMTAESVRRHRVRARRHHRDPDRELLETGAAAGGAERTAASRAERAGQESSWRRVPQPLRSLPRLPHRPSLLRRRSRGTHARRWNDDPGGNDVDYLDEDEQDGRTHRGHAREPDCRRRLGHRGQGGARVRRHRVGRQGRARQGPGVPRDQGDDADAGRRPDGRRRDLIAHCHRQVVNQEGRHGRWASPRAPGRSLARLPAAGRAPRSAPPSAAAPGPLRCCRPTATRPSSPPRRR